MLEISNISKTYDNGVQALRDVSLSVGQGMFGLLGPNGAGKSSLMRTIAALQAPDSGHIHFDGVDIVEHPQVMRDQLGYLPQEFGVYPKISAYELLDHLALLKGLHRKSERGEQVSALLQQTNLYEVRKKAVSSFSGGMRQRFGIAQALLGNPRLIIVDEPTAGLDPEERHRFHNLLCEIGESVVVVLSTHIVEDVRDLCPSMAVLADGTVQITGEPEKLIDGLRGKVWRKRTTKAEFAAIKERLVVLTKRLAGGQPLIHVLSEQQPEDGFIPVDPDLEDVYFSVLADEAVATCS
ncbi:MAG: ABC transporter ATP-binding protein [Gammaproteobacteria bacterium]|nr:ABC transporter ATP-binding protein [Gammaproteobacteria bacterium]